MSKPTHLDQLLQFSQFNHAFRGIKRAVPLVGSKDFENDAEHSYQLALTAWYLLSTLKLNLDQNKVVQYALAHDLVETYAGDTPAFTTNEGFKDSKAEREAAAIVRIEEEFPNFTQLHKAINCYERQTDDEAQFVYALDKLLPVINGILDKGRQWKEGKFTLEQVIEEKELKIKISRPVYALWLEIKELLVANEDKLFKPVKTKQSKQAKSSKNE